MTAFEREGAISWSPTKEDARGKLVERWKADTAADPAASRFVFAYTNVDGDVDALNASPREVRRERGERGADVVSQTKHGAAVFAVGDRLQFTDLLRSAKIYNGNAGVITAVDGRTGTLTAELDSTAGQGREVSWRPRSSPASAKGTREGSTRARARR